MPVKLLCIFFVFTVVLVSGCAGKNTQYLYIEGAKFANQGKHKRVEKNVKQNKKLEISEEFPVKGHRIESGGGIVIAERTFLPGVWLKTDQGTFKKITVYIPPGLEEKRIDFRSNPGVIGFFSNGSSSFPGMSGCYGYASEGLLHILKEGSDSVSISLDITFKTVSPAGWAEECGKVEYQRQHSFRKRNPTELTPWEGAKGDEVYDESFYLNN